MDTSKEYVKMCEKAYSDIGLLTTNGMPNQYMTKDFDGRFLLSGDDSQCDINGQLYRQDQLQDMVTDKFSSREQIPCLQKILAYKVQCTKEDKNPSTWEQLWLAFVMKEKYSKQWLAEKQEWVII